MQHHRFVFVGGLHRSGTTVLARCLSEHPLISGFCNTGVHEDEGQHLQTVFPSGKAYGGPGWFGFDSRAHLTETSALITEDNRRKLFSEWKGYWDLERPILLEKSPPNLIRMRFLQELFPDSCFIVVIRHPVAVSYATQKWSWTPISELIEHWLVCHERFEQDKPYIRQLFVLKYEDLATEPQNVLESIYSFLDVHDHANQLLIRPDVNKKYLKTWQEYQKNPDGLADVQDIREQYGTRVSRFGYSLYD